MLYPPASAPDFTARTYDGRTVKLSDYSEKTVLLSFFRYARCPLCNAAIYELLVFEPVMKQIGLEFIAVFESRPEKFPRYIGGRKSLPFPAISDPENKLFKKFQVEKRRFISIFNPKAMIKTLSALFKGFPQLWPDGNLGRIPAFFLIRAGKIEYSYYGKHVGDTVRPELVRALLSQFNLVPNPSNKKVLENRA